MNIITWKAYLRNSYYEYELARNLPTRNKNQNSFQNVVRVLPTFTEMFKYKILIDNCA